MRTWHLGLDEFTREGSVVCGDQPEAEQTSGDLLSLVWVPEILARWTPEMLAPSRETLVD